ncbi:MULTISPECIES: type III-B CRISPR module RAMP protein Cmr4 [Cylindrospermopsis]|jgi:CRISPR-associated protein Cmr4|uniref:Type III-B CRISPR module RAMP protein Cmr4 n=1 Tax=Cylindrospermopsis curvispora GIHE-G1 TaxID=2666332 RepID=A0A7H0F4I0_9CYAN|nr:MULTISPECIES: type III-B CRISPR module RAMP protein Cmr4 [Cylindrospermopsis]MBU6345648.1 type III-B CRISPR module RAMP protein Cmr4 [Cyanobacteria bacterium REEB494]MEB3145172.1 type III-B CRISPR module RAMP protein Cmr4 [Cylindrospermopsis raciborskii]QNP30946.1 type III-B CRISPR module RAMP protein Cmr4 [Cylindrospermopsis curvispora GIHE-G1]UJL32309.1 type III-B CRISPR module RAMP protein Cmr4 [Cylindrospermopsis raciborskii Cr2010]UJS04748.1 type III-B CRISPR module RAMP protein Cmr4 [
MYTKQYGIIETLAPVHVGATAGEESGNLNLIFRDQFTQTGIIPGSSIRGRLRAETRILEGEERANHWYGNGADDDKNNESIVKFEYASIIWIPVFCPGQPIVWVTSPRLLKRYQRIAGDTVEIKKNGQNKLLREISVPTPYTGSTIIKTKQAAGGKRTIFFNLGFLEINNTEDLSAWFPELEQKSAVVVDDGDIGMIHDMALYRQSRVRLQSEQKVVDKGGFFNTEALPEGTILVFPIAIRNNIQGEQKWQAFGTSNTGDIYLGGLESIGFGHCQLTVKGA